MARARSHLAAVGRDVSLAEGTYSGEDGGGYRWRIRVAPLALSTPAPPADPNYPPPRVRLFAIEVAIAWREDGRPREVVLRTDRVTSLAPP